MVLSIENKLKHVERQKQFNLLLNSSADTTSVSATTPRSLLSSSTYSANFLNCTVEQSPKEKIFKEFFTFKKWSVIRPILWNSNKVLWKLYWKLPNTCFVDLKQASDNFTSLAPLCIEDFRLSKWTQLWFPLLYWYNIHIIFKISYVFENYDSESRYSFKSLNDIRTRWKNDTISYSKQVFMCIFLSFFGT